ncbi:prenyltransferase/squalene oxidase repeat-containing protein [Actinocrispum wychmicini]|uniref:Prenyltransferase/squalene oxidase-like repeat protein n=1 Tax=Actinocrispum wychmicini TaxID=1213861 RepID=A0A4R2J5T2_9PSEU|nr:prenyltransferase/squalene oxidase repeat-containing protein [Actinocrispum wychmicini]TCO54291.1 prenyltransferase/squalene oxidase-like repeat protein [Actinocrispum wychmicini]
MRLRSLAVALLCVTTMAVAVPGAAVADGGRTVDRADAAAGWLARQLVDGERFEVDFNGTKFPDQGLTIDAILAFASAGVSGTNGGKAIAWLAKPEILSGYIGDGGTEAYAGATAKATLAAEVRGVNPASFGGVDLPTRLRGLLTPAGRFSDRSQFGDFSNAFSQSLAIIALKRTPGGVPVSAVDFAVGTQCPDGGFPLFFGASTCVSDTDSTAMVVQALLAVGRTTDANEGLAWLVSKQQANGGISVGSGDAATAPNTNTTGLAGQALKAGGRLLAAVKAKRFIVSVQVGCAGQPADRGAIAYDSSGVNPATVVRATAQAILGLGGPSLAQLSAAGSRPGAPELACRAA